MIDVSKMRLLKKSEVSFSYLRAFKDRFGKKHIDSSYTSLASFLSYGQTNYVGGNYWLADKKFGAKSAYFVNNNWKENKYEVKSTPIDSKLGLRLVIPYAGELEQELDYSDNSRFYFAKTIKFGEYPQFNVHKDFVSTVLELNYSNKSLDTTNKKYQINGSLLPEYIYNGKKYVRVELEQDNVEWFEVRPIEWIVDSKKKLLISSYCLSGNLTHDEACNMVKIMIDDIVPSKTVKLHEDLTTLISDELTLSDEIINLINKIYDNVKDSSKKADYLKQVKDAIDKYETELEKLKPEFKPQNNLGLGLSVPLVYSDLYAILMNIQLETKIYRSKDKEKSEVVVSKKRMKKGRDYTRDDVNELIFNSVEYLKTGQLNGELLNNVVFIKDLIANAKEKDQEIFTTKAIELILSFKDKCDGIDYEFTNLDFKISRYLRELSDVIKKQNKFNEEEFIKNALLETNQLLTKKNNELAERNRTNFKSDEQKVHKAISDFITDIVNCYRDAFDKLDEENREKLKLFFLETLKKCNVVISGDMSFDALKEIASIYYDFQGSTSNIVEYYKSIDKVC